MDVHTSADRCKAYARAAGEVVLPIERVLESIINEHPDPASSSATSASIRVRRGTTADMFRQSSMRELGTVIWFEEIKGVGRIRADVDGHVIFVHFAAVRAPGYRRLLAGQRVEFEREPSPGPWREEARGLVVLDRRA